MKWNEIKLIFKNKFLTWHSNDGILFNLLFTKNSKRIVQNIQRVFDRTKNDNSTIVKSTNSKIKSTTVHKVELKRKLNWKRRVLRDLERQIEIKTIIYRPSFPRERGSAPNFNNTWLFNLKWGLHLLNPNKRPKQTKFLLDSM